MKILHVTHGYAPESVGGIETYVAGLLARQRAAGADARLLTGSMAPWPTCGVEALADAGVGIERVHRDDEFFDHHVKAWHPGIGELFTAMLDRVRPEVVHVHQWIRLTSELVELTAARGIPAVVTLHDVYTTCPRAFRVDRAGQACARPATVASCLRCVPRYGHESDDELAEGIELFFAQTRSELLSAQRLVVADGSTADFVSAERDVPRERFAVLPMPYEARFRGMTRPHTLPAPDEPLRLCHFGLLAHHKGVAVLVEAFAQAWRAGLRRKAELHLYGRAETPEFEARLRRLAQGTPVFLHGPYDAATLAAAPLHVAVFPSLAFETFAFVLDEAFELGLPVLVSDRGALARRAGGAAIRVPPGDLAAWQRALAAVVADPAPLARLAAAIPARGGGWDAHVAALQAVYAAAASEPPRRGEPGVPLARRTAFRRRVQESARGRSVPPGGPS